MDAGLLTGNAAKIAYASVLQGHLALPFSMVSTGVLARPILRAAQTHLRQDQYFELLKVLGPRHRVMMGMFPSGWQTIVARGTDEELNRLTPAKVRIILEKTVSDFEETVSLGRILRSGQRVFNLHREDPFITRVSLMPIEDLFSREDLGHRFPVYLNWFQAAALAALSEEGYRLPHGWEWRIAAGNLNEKRFRDPEMLRTVAVLEEKTPSEVGTKVANNFSLYDMLGLAHEWTTDPHDPTLSMDDTRTSMQVYGGAYYDSVQAAFVANPTFFPALTTFNGLGVRFFADAR